MQKFYLLSAMCLLAASPVQALVRNGSFEDIPAGKSIPRHWQLATAFAGKVDSGAAEGEKCFKLDGKDGSGILIQSLKLQPGKTYTLSWQVKADKAEQKFRLYIEYSTHTKRFAGTRWGSGFAGKKWEKHTLTFTLPDDVRSSTLVLRQAKGNGAIWFDDFKLVESTPQPNAPDVSREKFVPKPVTIRNAGFESVGKNGAPVAWTNANGAGKIDGNAAEGDNCIMLNKEGGNGIFIQSVKLLPGKTYTISYQVKAANAGQKYMLYVEYSTFTKRFAGAFWGSGSAGTAWEKRSFTFTMPKDVKYSTLVLRQVKASGTIWFDDFEAVEEKTAPKPDAAKVPRKADSVLNSGFEESLTGWESDTPQIIKLDISNAKSSKTSLLFTDKGTVVQGGIPVARNTRYRLTVNVMCAEFNHPYRFFVGWKALPGEAHGGISQKFGLERQDGFTAWQTKSIEFVTPVKPFDSMYITLENLAPGKVWFDNVTLEKVDSKKIIPVLITLDSPAYRNTFYASSPVKEISGKIKFNVPVKFPAAVNFELTGSDGKKISAWNHSVTGKDGSFKLPLDSATLAEGKYLLTAVVTNGKEQLKTILPLRKVKQAEYEVLPDQNNMFRINGQPFFPIGLYEPDFTEEDFQKYQHLGFNTVLYMSSNAPSIKLVADKAHQYGLKLVSHYCMDNPQVTQHPAFLGYHNADEPAWMGSDCDTLVKKYRQMAELDPYHPVWMNHAPRNDIETLKMYNEACDVSGVDIYPVTSSPKGSDHSDLDDRTISCVGKYAIKMRQSVDDRKPIIMVLQGFAWAHLRNRNAKNARYPSYEETRFMVWDSIISGANGVFYYATNRMSHDHQLWLDMAKVNHEVQSLAPVITSPPGAEGEINGGDQVIHAVSRNYNGNQVIFIINTSNTARKFKVDFPAFSGKCFELYKSEPVKVTGHTFEVSLAPYEVKFFSAEPLKTNFDPAKNYSFAKTENVVDHQEIPFDNIGTGVMGYNWKGSWIWSTARPFAPKVYLRKKFTVKGSLKSAHIAISADASYRRLVNGKEVSNGACCWMAQHYDLTKYFHDGENLIAIEGIGDGGPTGVLFEGKITGTGGSEYFISDPSWKCTAEAPADWFKPGFDDRKWYPAVVTYPVSKGVWGRIPIVP